MQHVDASDDQGTVQERECVEENQASFSLDDAFSDGDDIDPSYEFSSIAIRADLARAVSETEHPGDAEESPNVNGAGDIEEPLSGLSLLVCGFLVTLREPHHL